MNKCSNFQGLTMNGVGAIYIEKLKTPKKTDSEILGHESWKIAKFNINPKL